MVSKLEKILFYIFLFIIPFQIRIFLVNAGPPAGGEWNSIFVYLGDIILFLIFLLFLKRLKTSNFQFSIFNFQKRHWLLIIFLIIAFLSIFVSSNFKLSAYKFLKLFEFVFLFIYAVRKLSDKNIYRVLLASGVFQAILAIIQFIKQGSIGIKFIEAGVYSPNLPGVANFILRDERILRSYASFSHPNVLAGFLLLAIFCFYYLFLQGEIKRKSRGYFLFPVICYLLLVFGLFLTFSRTAILVFLIMSLIMFLMQILKTRRQYAVKLFGLFLVSCVLVIIILFPYLKARFFTISFQEQAVDLRFFYNRIALSMIKEKPLLGIGIGNFVNYSQNYQAFLRAAAQMAGEQNTSVPEWIYQPVHNIYLLIASEIGIFGLLAFLVFIGMILLKWLKACFLPAHYSPRHQAMAGGFLIFCFLLIALADHYFLTLQAGGIMFWLALALAKN